MSSWDAYAESMIKDGAITSAAILDRKNCRVWGKAGSFQGIGKGY